MKQAVFLVVMVGISLAVVFGQVSFDNAKALEPIETDDVVVVLEVPVLKEGAVRPGIPDELRRLRRIDYYIYDSNRAGATTSCLIVMVLPKEHVPELRAAVEKYQAVREVELAEVAGMAAQYPGIEPGIARLAARVANADTPMAVVKD